MFVQSCTIYVCRATFQNRVRDIDELTTLAQHTGFELEERVEMPANNMTLVWKRVG